MDRCVQMLYALVIDQKKTFLPKAKTGILHSLVEVDIRMSSQINASISTRIKVVVKGEKHHRVRRVKPSDKRSTLKWSQLKSFLCASETTSIKALSHT